MQRRDPHDASRFHTHKRGLAAATVVASIAYCAALTPAFAGPISYVLSPPITALGITVTGGFQFDATGPTLDAVDFAVTGGPQPGTYTVPVSATSAEIVGEIAGTTDQILLLFANPLGNVPDPVTGFAFPPSAPDPAPVSGSDAVPVPTTEPTSLTLLGGAFGLFPLMRRLSWRRRSHLARA